MEQKQILNSVNSDRRNTKNTHNAESLLPKCIICGEVPANGIMGGIFVKGQFLCDCCEQRIVSLDEQKQSPETMEDYALITSKLKKLWKWA